MLGFVVLLPNRYDAAVLGPASHFSETLSNAPVYNLLLRKLDYNLGTAPPPP